SGPPWPCSQRVVARSPPPPTRRRAWRHDRTAACADPPCTVAGTRPAGASGPTWDTGRLFSLEGVFASLQLQAMQLKSLSLALALCVTAACSHGSKDVNLKTSATTWPSLAEPPPPASAPALYDAAVIVAIEDYQYVDDIPGAKA